MFVRVPTTICRYDRRFDDLCHLRFDVEDQQINHRWLRSLGCSNGIDRHNLLSVGEQGVQSLQSFIVITAVPVSFVLLPICGSYLVDFPLESRR